MTDVVLLIGNPRPGSRTRALADAVADALAPALPDLTGRQALELGSAIGISYDLTPAYGNPPVEDPLGLVRSARLLVVGTPTYKGTYTGLLKLFLDRYRQGELAGVVAVPVAIAASPAHQVSVARSLRDLIEELGATVPAEPLVPLDPDMADGVAPVAAAWDTANAASLVADTAAPRTPLAG